MTATNVSMQKREELSVAKAKHTATENLLKTLKQLQPVLSGEAKPGDANTMEAIAFSIKQGFSIPLKYTQSAASLKTLYSYAIEKNDRQFTLWTERQMNRVLGSNVATTITNEIHTKKIMPSVHLSNRQRFIQDYKTMSLKELYSFTFRENENSFWRKQLQRVHKVNAIREQITGPINELKPFSDLLKLTYQVEHMAKFDGENSKQKIIRDSHVSPYVIIPVLIQYHSHYLDMQAIFSSPYIKSGFIKKSFAVSKETIEKLFQKNGIEQNYYLPYLNK